MPRKPGFKLSEETKRKIGNANRGGHPKRSPHTEETKRKIGNANRGRLIGRKISAETKRRISEATKGIPRGPMPLQQRQNLSKSLKGQKRGPTTAAVALKISNALKGREFSAATRMRMSNSHKGKILTQSHKNAISLTLKKSMTPERLAFMGEIVKKRWQDPDYQQKMRKAFWTRPTSIELIFMKILGSLNLGLTYTYTGDLVFWIGGRNPDFARRGHSKKCIELYGDYWHRNDDPQERIDHFAKYGWECLVIWEHELRDEQKVKERVTKFDNTT